MNDDVKKLLADKLEKESKEELMEIIIELIEIIKPQTYCEKNGHEIRILQQSFCPSVRFCRHCDFKSYV